MTGTPQMLHALSMLAQATVPAWCGVGAVAALGFWLQGELRRLVRRQDAQVRAVLETLAADPGTAARPGGDGQPSWGPAVTGLADQLRLQRMLLRRDPLTGLANRRGFDEAMHKAWQRSSTHGEACALLMIDIDHFKQVNDSIGHRQADEALRQVAAVLREHVRPADTVARWGGEEFAVLLPDTSHGRAAAIAERLRQQISRQPAGLTVSIGIAAYPDHAASPDALLDAADAALYRAKTGGRDRCETADRADARR